jgi:hypothetical protein
LRISVIQRFSEETLPNSDLHAVSTFRRTASNPVNWNIASRPGPVPSNTSTVNRAPSGSDLNSAAASSG